MDDNDMFENPYKRTQYQQRLRIRRRQPSPPMPFREKLLVLFSTLLVVAVIVLLISFIAMAANSSGAHSGNHRRSRLNRARHQQEALRRGKNCFLQTLRRDENCFFKR